MGQLLDELDSAELTEWMAYDRIDPFGAEREDLRLGILASTVGNHGYRELKRAYKPQDFMPFLEKPKPQPVLLVDAKAQSRLILETMFPKHARTH